jgi:hypothetical protein
MDLALSDLQALEKNTLDLKDSVMSFRAKKHLELKANLQALRLKVE